MGNIRGIECINNVCLMKKILIFVMMMSILIACSSQITPQQKQLYKQNKGKYNGKIGR
jgi:hypothetical protein